MFQNSKNQIVIFLNDKKNKTRHRNALKKLISGILILFVGIWYCHIIKGDPFTKFLLIQNSKTISGYITDVSEEIKGDEEGTYYTYFITYTYELHEHIYENNHNDGGDRKNLELSNLKIPYPIEVEYLPKFPNISRIKGTGTQSMIVWFFYELIGSIILYGIVICIGIMVSKNGYKELKKLWYEYTRN